MKKGLTYLAVVLDRSGSMSSVREAVVKGLNGFIKEQKTVPGDALLTLAQFSSGYDLKYNGVSLKEVPEFTLEDYVPNGWTALLDAMGKTINDVGAKLSLMPEDEKPEKVIFIVQTDGEENWSKEFSLAKVKEMVTHQREKYSWDFVFLGANLDAIATGATFGMKINSTLQYANTVTGLDSLYTTIGSAVKTVRTTGQVLSFSDDDRKTNDPLAVVAPKEDK